MEEVNWVSIYILTVSSMRAGKRKAQRDWSSKQPCSQGKGEVENRAPWCSRK